jgi:ribosome-associated protein
MTSKQISKIVIRALEDLKAFDVLTIDVKKISSITDIIIIASGGSSRQVKALAEKTIESVKEKGVKPLGTEGVQQGDWALIDLGDVIVHIMRPVIRDYYQLEKLWSPETEQMSSV